MTALFQTTRIVVVGDVMLDRYWHGRAARISPEAPVPVVSVEMDEVRPGGAANVALNLAALDVPVTLLGLIGDDEAAGRLRHALQIHDVQHHLVVTAAPTITKLRVMSQSHQMIRLDFESPFDAADATALAESADEVLSSASVLILSDYGKGSLDAPRWIEAARERGIPVVVDPKGRDYLRYRGATCLTPNLGEFEAVVGVVHSDQELLTKAVQLIQTLNLTSLLITRSEQGMILVRADGSSTQWAATAREVADVTGAGDTVIATFAAALGHGYADDDAARWANLAAGLVVSKLGTATVSARELRAAEGVKNGVLESEEALRSYVAEARAAGHRIVMTNGCFYILHAGHVAYLREAASLGDRLLVALNADASVSRLKGPERPLNSLRRRMEVLAGLNAVDAVIGFEDDTPEHLIDVVRPDVLVKGGDYKSIEEVVGFSQVQAYGGVVKVLGEVENLSTTRLISKIRAPQDSSTS